MVGVVIGLLTAGLLAGCGEDPADPPRTPPPPPPVTGEVSDDFFAEPGYLGQTVTVTATVDAVLGPTSFVVGGGQYADESLLVVSAEGLTVESGDHVRVTGTVERFGYGAYADRFGLAEDATDYVPFEGEEFLVAAEGSRLEPGLPSESGG